jgi:hypothetical protein
MESGLYLSIFSSWEVIAACLFVMFLLPFVFFMASTKSRRRIPRRVLKIPRPPKRRAESPPAKQDEEEEDVRNERPSARRGERSTGTDDDR